MCSGIRATLRRSIRYWPIRPISIIAAKTTNPNSAFESSGSAIDLDNGNKGAPASGMIDYRNREIVL